ncbi:hypothetical protein JZ751_008209, partial [Albula glossodonta]
VLSNTHFSCAGRNLRYVPSEIPISAEHLDFSFNNLSNLNQAVFPPLPHLHVLDLTRCHIQLITDNAFFNVRNVTTFILTGNHIKNLISHDLTMVQQLIVVETRLASLEDLHIQPMSKLQILNAGTNNIKSIRIPPYLINCSNFRVLDLHANKITVITANDTLPLRQIRSRNITLILSRNYIFQIQPGAFQNIHLQGLYLLDSFPSSTVTKSGLSGLSGLKVDKLVVGHYKDNVKIVNVEDDFMDGLCSVDFQEIYFRQKEEISNGFNLFHCMSNATKISVLQGKWNDMEIVEFQQLKELQLRSCKIHFMPTMQFSNIKSLETLIVKDNVEQTEFRNCGIEDLRRSSFTQLDRLRHLALSGNRLMAVDFLTNPSLVSLTQIDAGQNNIVSIPLNILSHLPLNLSAFDLSRNPIECSCSNTDLIIKDEAWVMEELVEKIEGGVPPIHLCLHVRDFQAGKSITSNIIDEGITGSRKVIVLVSQHFIDSDWCRFEFEVAQSWVVLERNASLIIIILEDVEEEKTKKVMGLHKHLKRNTYLKWKGNALSDVMFWNRLRSAIISGK